MCLAPTTERMSELEDHETLVEQLRSAYVSEREAAHRRLANAGPAAIAPFLEALRRDGRQWVLRHGWIDPILAQGEQALPALFEALQAEDPELRRLAAGLLRIRARRGSRESCLVEPLARALHDSDREAAAAAGAALAALEETCLPALVAALDAPERRAGRAAMSGLCGMRLPAAVEPLCRVLETGPPKLRAAAAEALKEIGDRRALEPLLKAVEDPSSRTRAEAAWALGRLRDARAVDPLIQALADPNRSVRIAAAYLLGDFGDPRVQQPLARALDDPSSGVRSGAAHALAELGDPAALPILAGALAKPEADPWTLCRELARFGPPAVPYLLPFLSDSRVRVRVEAAAALPALGQAPAAIDPLISALGDPDRDARDRASSLLYRLGHPAVPPLLHALSDPDPVRRRMAAATLGRLRPAQAVEPLKRLLHDRDPFVRRRARGALQELGIAV